MLINIEKEIKDNFGFIKNQCNMRAGKNREHLLSVVLEKIWKYRDSFNGENFKGWATTIIKNSNIDLTREPNFKYSFCDINEKFSLKSYLYSDFDNKQFIEVVSEIVKNNFNNNHYKVFVLRFIDGYKFNEIAKIVEMKEANTKLIIHKITKFLRSSKKLIQIWEQ